MGRILSTRFRERLLAARHSPAVWAIGDQGIVSVGTFVLTIVLARNLSAADFGVFGVLMGIVVTAVTVHTSLIGIPLMVLTGRSEHRALLPTVALGLTAVTSAVFAVALAVAVLVLDRPGLFAPSLLALVGVQLQETTRRSLMGRLHFRRAAGGDAVSYLGQAACITAVAVQGTVTVGAAFLVMGITSIIAAALQLWQVRPTFEAHAFRRETVRPFWRLGRALVVVNGIGAVTAQTFLWMLGFFQGVAAVGSYQALLTVVGPTNPLMLAANSIVTTRVAHIHEPDPVVEERLELGVARRYGLAVGIPLVAYCAALVAAPGAALELFFGAGSVYAGLTTDLRIFVLLSLGQYTYFVAAGVLNARQDTGSLLRAQLGSALVVPLAVVVTALGTFRETVVASAVSNATRGALAVRGVLRRRAGSGG